MKKILAAVLAAVMALSCVAAFAESTEETQTGVYQIYNLTGETVTSVAITDNVNGAEQKVDTALEAGASFEMTYSIPASEDGKHRLTLTFVTESGYEGKFETLSIETAPISLLSAEAMTGATMISFSEPQQTGVYKIFNLTGEAVNTLTIIDPTSGKVEAIEEPLAADASIEMTFSLPASEDGHSRLTLAFVTESGYEGKFETLSIETAPISLLSAEAMTGATQISFTAPPQTGVYQIYNLTGETVTSVTITDNVDGSEQKIDGTLEAGASIEMTYTIPGTEDGHHRLTLTFVTESGYEGKFETLSIETAPISLLSAEAMTGATQISFSKPE